MTIDQGEAPKPQTELEEYLTRCEQGIGKIVAHGEDLTSAKLDLKQYEWITDDFTITAYEAFSYWQNDMGPAVGISIEYKSPDGFTNRDLLYFSGHYKYIPRIDFTTTNPEVPNREAAEEFTLEDIRMFEPLIDFTIANLPGEPSRSNQAWRS